MWIWGNNAQAQPMLSAYIEIDNPRPKLGEPFQATLVIRYDERIEVLQRPPLSGEWGIFEILKADERKTTSNDGQVVEQQSFTLVAWQTGDHSLPKSEILYRVRGTSDLTRYTLPDIFLSIPSMLQPDVLTLRPDEAPIMFSFLPTWAVFIITSLIIIAIISFYELLRYHARQNAHIIISPDPQTRLLEALEYHRTDPNYTNISDTLRDYLHQRYGIMAQEMTDQEIIARLKSDGRLASYQLAKLSEILEHITVGKFSTTTIAYSPEKLILMIKAWAQNVHMGEQA
jgi:hypothetical protein